MKIPKKAKIWKAASADTFWPALQCVKFDGNKLVATDGHIAVQVLVEDAEDDKPCLIPARVMGMLKPIPRKPKNEIKTNGHQIEIRRGFDKIFVEPSNEKFPDAQKLLDEAEKNSRKKYVLRIGLNANLVKTLADATGESRLVFHFDLNDFTKTGYNEKVPVRSLYGDFLGIIMPIHLEEKP